MTEMFPLQTPSAPRHWHSGDYAIETFPRYCWRSLGQPTLPAVPAATFPALGCLQSELMDELATTYEAEYPVIVRFAEGMLAGNGDGHDIAQEAFLRLRRSDVPAARTRFWLLRVARNLALNELRRRRRFERVRLLFPWIGRMIRTSRRTKTDHAKAARLPQPAPPGLRAPPLLPRMGVDDVRRDRHLADVSVAKVKRRPSSRTAASARSDEPR